MATNPDKLNYLYETLTPGQEGRKHDGRAFAEAKWANKNSADLLNRFNHGISGVRHEGDLYGILRRTEANTATTAQLVSALKAVAGGEAFDEAKLLAGVKAAAEAGTAAAIESIDTTVTIQKEGGK